VINTVATGVMEGGITPPHPPLLPLLRTRLLLLVATVQDTLQLEHHLLRITRVHQQLKQLHLRIMEPLLLPLPLPVHPLSKVVAMIMEVLLLHQDMEALHLLHLMGVLRLLRRLMETVLLHQHLMDQELRLHLTMAVALLHMVHHLALLRQVVEVMAAHHHRVEGLHLHMVVVTVAMVLLLLVLMEEDMVDLRHQAKDMVEVHLHHKMVATRIAVETATTVVEVVDTEAAVVVVAMEEAEGMVDMEEVEEMEDMVEEEMVGETVAMVVAETAVDVMVVDMAAVGVAAVATMAVVEGMAADVEVEEEAAVEIRCSKTTQCLCRGCRIMPLKMMSRIILAPLV